MEKRHIGAICIAIVTLSFFLVVSIITERWGFFLWSLLPVFTSSTIVFFKKEERQGT